MTQKLACKGCELLWPEDLILNNLCPLCIMKRVGNSMFISSEILCLWEDAISYAYANKYNINSEKTQETYE